MGAVGEGTAGRELRGVKGGSNDGREARRALGGRARESIDLLIPKG